MRVLVVDDYPDTAQAACRLLSVLGHEARAAHCGKDALAIVEELDPDIVILDLGLPDMSGYQVARELRSRQGKRPYIAAMTGWGTVTDRVHSHAAGIDQHVVKPADVERLTDIIANAQRRLEGVDDLPPRR